MHHDAEAHRLTGLLAAPNPTTVVMEGFQLHSLVRLGDPERVEQAITELDDRARAGFVLSGSMALL
jgi:hypothetical protein